MEGIPPPQIIRSSRSSISLHITPEGKVVVKAPRLVPKFLIERFVKEKEDWIYKTLRKVKERQPKPKKYTEGEEFLFLGNSVRFHLVENVEIAVKGAFLAFPKALQFRAKKELASWYQRQAKEIITQRVEHHASNMKATYTNIFFSDTTSKWGTCFPDNTLQFNWRLIMAPIMVIDYVVIHELTHTTKKHHQESFWANVRLFTPAYKQHRKWLEQHAHMLQF